MTTAPVRLRSLLPLTRATSIARRTELRRPASARVRIRRPARSRIGVSRLASRSRRVVHNVTHPRLDRVLTQAVQRRNPDFPVYQYVLVELRRRAYTDSPRL